MSGYTVVLNPSEMDMLLALLRGHIKALECDIGLNCVPMMHREVLERLETTRNEPFYLLRPRRGIPVVHLDDAHLRWLIGHLDKAKQLIAASDASIAEKLIDVFVEALPGAGVSIYEPPRD